MTWTASCLPSSSTAAYDTDELFDALESSFGAVQTQLGNAAPPAFLSLLKGRLRANLRDLRERHSCRLGSPHLQQQTSIRHLQVGGGRAARMLVRSAYCKSGIYQVPHDTGLRSQPHAWVSVE